MLPAAKGLVWIEMCTGMMERTLTKSAEKKTAVFFSADLVSALGKPELRPASFHLPDHFKHGKRAQPNC